MGETLLVTPHNAHGSTLRTRAVWSYTIFRYAKPSLSWLNLVCSGENVLQQNITGLRFYGQTYIWTESANNVIINVDSPTYHCKLLSNSLLRCHEELEWLLSLLADFTAKLNVSLSNLSSIIPNSPSNRFFATWDNRRYCNNNNLQQHWQQQQHSSNYY